MSSYGAATSSNNNSPLYNGSSTVEPRRMELSLNAEDGSLQTAPLFLVLLAATDGLYSDLYNMSEGELDVITTANQAALQDDAAATAEEDDAPEPVTVLRKKERMSNLSFAQRRHELAWRLAANGKCLQHVAALTAAAACTDLGPAVQVSTTALQHTRTAWVQADEAQDALFFFHAQLFPARAAPHDIYGASDLLLRGQWYDLPRDLLLHTDRYDTSQESTWSKAETDRRWQLTVRDKLIRGEVGWLRRRHLLEPNNVARMEPESLWKVSLKGGIVKFTVGKPKMTATRGSTSAQSMQYPIEALLTVWPSQQLSAWTLLSVTVNVRAKTGEFNHQLETSNRQRYDLHRLAATAMNREEFRSKQEHATAELSKLGSSALHDVGAIDSEASSKADRLPPSRPLNALFQVAHTFMMSWMLEVLSAQAQALRRGVWAATEGDSVRVTPVGFVENGEGFMSISFWKVDDSYGPPVLGELMLQEDQTPAPLDVFEDRVKSRAQVSTEYSNQLTLMIRAQAHKGIKVLLSGGDNMMHATGQQRKENETTIQKLLDAASNPLALSASDALLAATKLCAAFKCRAVVEALQASSSVSGDMKHLPSWMQMKYAGGSVAVAARIQYHGAPYDTSRGMPVLFHITCDARTGSFVPVFPRSMQLLRRLACNDGQASEELGVRIASVPLNRRKAVGSNSAGRAVREAFDSLIRSMNLIGQRVGVGSKWEDIDDQSTSLRERSISTACADVKSALTMCSGMAALYGIVPVAIKTSVGLEASSEM
jgi:hypothetical protein